MVQVLPNGQLLDYKEAFGEQELKAPNAARTLGSFMASLRARISPTAQA